MPDAFLLAEIQELGRRAADAPAADAVEWSGMRVGDDDLRAIHAALHPSLVLAAVAGYEPEEVLLLPPGGADVLDIVLSPRIAGVVGADQYDVAGLLDPGSLTAVIRLPTRPGLRGTAVPPPAGNVVEAPDGSYLVLDLGAAAAGGAPVDVVGALLDAQADVVDGLAAAIAAAHADAGPTLTGLVSVLDPALWDFPDELVEGSGSTTEALRDLGRPIAAAALADRGSLEAFLVEEANGRLTDGDALPSVQRRLTGDLATAVPVDPPFPDDDARELERAWQREAEALFDDLHPDVAVRPPFRVHDHRRLTYLELVLDAINQGLFGTVAFDLDTRELAYGGHDLRYTRVPPAGGVDPTDRDPDPDVRAAQTYVYGGVAVTATFASAAATPRFVGELRDDLAAVGFGPLADADVLTLDGKVQNAARTAVARRRFGAWLEAALREFQIYAAMPQVARKPLAAEPQPGAGGRSLGSTLIPVANDHQYTGPRSGVLNAETRELLKMWVERDWHCPVVVENRTLSSAQLTALRDAGPATSRTATVLAGALIDQNVWRARQVEAGSFVGWDHTGRATVEPYRPGQPMVLCRYVSASWGGAGAFQARQDVTSAYLYPSAEITPATAAAELPDRADDPAFWSTFRVARAVSEVESMGYFDGLNGYDTAITSGGPFHWTLGLMKSAGGGNPATFWDDAVAYPGELGAFLAYLDATEPAEFGELFGRFGIRPHPRWVGAAGPHYVPGHRKYTGWVAFEDDDSAWVDLRRPQVLGADPVASQQDSLLAESLKTWHWTHRILYASRTSPTMTARMWEFSRARLRELLSTPWRADGVVKTITDHHPDGTPFDRTCTIGDVFTSEQAVAMIERQHVFDPHQVFGIRDKAAQWLGAGADDMDLTELQDLYDIAVAVAGHQDAADWGDDEQAAIIAAMLLTRVVVVDGKNTTVSVHMSGVGYEEAASWPIWGVPPAGNPRRYDRSWLPQATLSPSIGPLPNLHVQPGDAPVVVAGARRVSGAGLLIVDLAIEDPPPGLEIISVDDDAGRLQVLLPLDAEGRWVGVVTATDGLFTTTRRFDLDVSENGGPPSPTGYEEVVARTQLDPRHRSFQLDATPLLPFPAPAD